MLISFYLFIISITPVAKIAIPYQNHIFASQLPHNPCFKDIEELQNIEEFWFQSGISAGFSTGCSGVNHLKTIFIN